MHLRPNSSLTTVDLGLDNETLLATDHDHDHDQAVVVLTRANWNYHGRLHSHHLLIKQAAATP
jgi:hypothetical protein